jgi:hypothetical protein
LPTNPYVISKVRSINFNHEPLRRNRRGGLHRFRHRTPLLAEGASRVVVVDNLLTGRESNIEEIRSRIEFQRADIRNYERSRRSSAAPP